MSHCLAVSFVFVVYSYPVVQIAAVEAGVERLRDKSDIRSGTDAAASELDVYVPPDCSPSKESDTGVQLAQEVERWLRTDTNGTSVLLLHGNSGSGKSLYGATICVMRLRIFAHISLLRTLLLSSQSLSFPFGPRS